MNRYRTVAAVLAPKPPQPPPIGCSHPTAVDITTIDNLLVRPPHSLTMCNACTAHWCTPR